jgi:hypothetical protein
MNDNFPSGRMLTMADAVARGYSRLAVKCPGREHYVEVPWHETRKPFTTPLPDVLRAMRCKRCGAKPDCGTLTNQSMIPGAPRRPGSLPIYEVRTEGTVLLVG